MGYYVSKMYASSLVDAVDGSAATESATGEEVT
jgi:hypothetical protein